MKRPLALVALVACAVVTGSQFVTAQTAERRLASAKSLDCVFTTMSTGTWKEGQAQADVTPAKLSIGFEAIDADGGTARSLGAFVVSDIIVRMSEGTLHFVQTFREGPVYVTTVFPWETREGKLQAVHSRHEFTEVQLPGYTSRPEQYYGECTAVP